MSEQSIRDQPGYTNINHEEKTRTLLDRLNQAPVVDADELNPVLEQGRILSKIRIAQKLSSIGLDYVNDPANESSTCSNSMEQVAGNVDALESELIQVDSVLSADHILSKEQVEDTDSRSSGVPATKQASSDFLERRQTAICAETDPEIFFPEKGGSSKLAKNICKQSCDLKDECLSYAMKNDEKFGIWGGLSRTERRKLSKKMTA